MGNHDDMSDNMDAMSPSGSEPDNVLDVPSSRRETPAEQVRPADGGDEPSRRSDADARSPTLSAGTLLTAVATIFGVVAAFVGALDDIPKLLVTGAALLVITFGSLAVWLWTEARNCTTSSVSRKYRRWAVAATAVTLVAAVPGVETLTHLSGKQPASVDRFRELTRDVPPSSVERERWTSADLSCPAHTEWSERFREEYRGDVYALLTTGRHDAVTIKIRLEWGPEKWWENYVTVHPGVIGTRRGGTILAFKKDQSGPAPTVILRSDRPVCAVFGDAETQPRPAPLLYLRTPEWNKPAPTLPPGSAEPSTTSSAIVRSPSTR